MQENLHIQAFEDEHTKLTAHHISEVQKFLLKKNAQKLMKR